MQSLKYPSIDDLLIRIDSFKQLEQVEYVSYNTSYRVFINYFLDKDLLTENDLILATNFVYGWMPTILKFKNNNFNECVDLLNKSKKVDRLDKEDILKLKSLINNSLVGTSKLLHFVNPDKYAIWDSRVCNFLFNTTNNQFINNVDHFLKYLDICQQLIAKDEYNNIHLAYMTKSKNQNATKLRSIEQLMFLNSNKPLKRIT